MRRDARCDGGFTLLEVLVALAVVGMALGVVAGALSTGLVGHETASAADTALAVAEEQLTLAGAAPHLGVGKGVYAGRFAWKTTVAPYEDGDKTAADDLNALPRLYRIAVSVAWNDGRRSRELSLATLRLAAAPSP